MYKLTNGSTVQRLSDGAFIPADERNPDWREFQVWAAKNTPEAADPPPPPPKDEIAEIKIRLAALEQARTVR